MSKIKNYSLEIASHACDKVSFIVSKKNAMEYKQLVKKLPTYILKNGLILTLSFLISKFKNNNKDNNINQHEEAYINLIDWLNIRYTLGINEDIKSEKAIKEVFKIMKNKDLKLLTRESVNYFVWQKRFAEGLIFDKEFGDKDGEQ